MNTLTFKNLKNVKKPDLISDWTYIDLNLDIEKTSLFINKNKSIKGNDIKMSFDEQAIKNSIFNIFQTIPGERILLPTFGANLLAYVFSPVSKFIGEEIGNTVLNAIKIWEPRVVVDKVTVLGDPDNHTYNITILISIPTLKKRDIKLVGILSKEGFNEVLT